MKKIWLILPAIIISLIFFACKKGGPGGRTKIYVHVMNDSVLVSGARVYVKYGQNDSPGIKPSDYNANQLTDYTGKTVFDHLRRGEYFFYCVSADTAGKSISDGQGFEMLNSVGERAIVLELK